MVNLHHHLRGSRSDILGPTMSDLEILDPGGRRNGHLKIVSDAHPPGDSGNVARALAYRHVEQMAKQLEVAESVLEQARWVVDGPPPDDWSPAFAGERWPDAGALKRWREANAHYIQISQQVREAREGVERAYKETHRSVYWRGVYEQRLDELTMHYGGAGPQYQMLCERAAALDVRLQQIEAAERTDSDGEYRSLSELHLRYLAQLQKHTESTKSESYAGVQEALAKMLIAIEREIRPMSPQIWDRISEVVVETVGA